MRLGPRRPRRERYRLVVASVSRADSPRRCLEAMRDGLEDYDYLYLAYCALKDLQEAGLGRPELDALGREITPYFAPGNRLVTSLTQYTEDPAELEVVRERVGRYVEVAQRTLGR